MQDEHLWNRQGEKRKFIAQRGVIPSGHLIFMSDIDGIRFKTNPSIGELAQISSGQNMSRVRVEGSTITFQQLYCSMLKTQANTKVPLGEITLNSSIPWEIEFRGHVSNLYADLHELVLGSLDMLGGASQVMLLLPEPAETTFIYIPRGIAHSTLKVPPNVGIKLQVNGRVRHLFFDNRHLDAMEGDLRVENSNFRSVHSRYDITSAAVVEHLMIV